MVPRIANFSFCVYGACLVKFNSNWTKWPDFYRSFLNTAFLFWANFQSVGRRWPNLQLVSIFVGNIFKRKSICNFRERHLEKCTKTDIWSVRFSLKNQDMKSRIGRKLDRNPGCCVNIVSKCLILLLRCPVSFSGGGTKSPNSEKRLLPPTYCN